MNKYLYTSIIFIALCNCLKISAQESEYKMAGEDQEVKKYTLMERFEPDLILTANEREQLKVARFDAIKTKLSILDTMDISPRKREKLMNDVIEHPFSTRLSKTLVETKFDELE